ncbi:MAG: outer spore coat protein CotE [Bacilli bacterium]|nr:outer spore coat protein CotE [Bacilli bacterium]MBR1817526.1 outer spore coat protein CotE [Bacilli bacterium]
MANFKEIVTKAVIGKAKKTNTMKFSFQPDEKVDTILGCWVINHNFSGSNNNGKVSVNGSFDVNVWYSYDNDTKTKVNSKKFSYNELFSVPLKEESTLTNNSEIMVRSLKQPSVVNVNSDNQNINLEIEKELGVEIVGEAKIKVPVEDNDDDYEEILDDSEIEEVKEDYLEDVNQN